MRSLWERYYSEAHCIIFLIDSSDPSRLDEAIAAFDAVCAGEMAKNTPVLVFANKRDKAVSSARARAEETPLD